MTISNPTDYTLTKKDNLDTVAKADLIVQIADDMKALRIENLDVRKKTAVTSRMVIVSGTSDTHIRAITERVLERMREQGIKPNRKDPGPGGGWLLLDYGDVVFHAMLEEKRQFYDLETLWNAIQPNPDLLD
ncbi:MAG: ribosome silencing factor [Fimbriimonadaceae bacterium]